MTLRRSMLLAAVPLMMGCSQQPAPWERYTLSCTFESAADGRPREEILHVDMRERTFILSAPDGQSNQTGTIEVDGNNLLMVVDVDGQRPTGVSFSFVVNLSNGNAVRGGIRPGVVQTGHCEPGAYQGIGS